MYADPVRVEVPAQVVEVAQDDDQHEDEYLEPLHDICGQSEGAKQNNDYQKKNHGIHFFFGLTEKRIGTAAGELEEVLLFEALEHAALELDELVRYEKREQCLRHAINTYTSEPEGEREQEM